MSLAAGSRANAASYAWLLKLRHDRAARVQVEQRLEEQTAAETTGWQEGEHGVAVVEPAVYECTDQNVCSVHCHRTSDKSQLTQMEEAHAGNVADVCSQ